MGIQQLFDAVNFPKNSSTQHSHFNPSHTATNLIIILKDKFKKGMGQRGSTASAASTNEGPTASASASASTAGLSRSQQQQQERERAAEIERQRLRAAEEALRDRSRAEVGRLRLIAARVAETHAALDADAASFLSLLPFSRPSEVPNGILGICGITLGAVAVLSTIWQSLSLAILCALLYVSACAALRAGRHTNGEPVDPVLQSRVKAACVIVSVLCLVWRHWVEVLVAALAITLSVVLTECRKSTAAVMKKRVTTGAHGSSSSSGNGQSQQRQANSRGNTNTTASASPPPSSVPSRSLVDARFSDIERMLAGGVAVPADEDGEEAAVCNVCLFNRPDVAFIPCGHVRCCVECVRSLCAASSMGGRGGAVGQHRCPDCREVIAQVFYPARR